MARRPLGAEGAGAWPEGATPCCPDTGVSNKMVSFPVGQQRGPQAAPAWHGWDTAGRGGVPSREDGNVAHGSYPRGTAVARWTAAWEVA